MNNGAIRVSSPLGRMFLDQSRKEPKRRYAVRRGDRTTEKLLTSVLIVPAREAKSRGHYMNNSKNVPDVPKDDTEVDEDVSGVA